MKEKDGSIATGLNRFSALLAWWGAPNGEWSSNIEQPMKRFQAFTSDLQKAYREASSHQMEALMTENQRLSRLFQELLHSPQPQNAVAAQSSILTTLLEGASAQAKTWTELAQKVQECCAAVVREAAEEVGKQPREAVPAKPPAGVERQTAGDARRQAAHA